MFRKYFYTAVPLAILAAGCYFYRSLPSSSSVPFAQTRYVVIGCSAAGYSAARELAKNDPHAHVVCLSEEQHAPYDKTSLHGFVKGKRTAIELRSKNREASVNVQLGKKVVAIDRKHKKVQFFDNSAVPYDKLLIATGARPQVPEHLRPAFTSKNVLFYNSRAEVENLIERIKAKPTAKILIVGAGIRSLELADGLLSRFPEVALTILNRSQRLYGESGDENTDRIIAQRLRAKGIDFFAPAVIREISAHGVELTAHLEDRREIVADLIVFNQGTTPNSDVAKAAGIVTYDDGSIKVDDELKTNDPHILAAGDVAGFLNPIGSGTVRSNKWRAAKTQGKIAAKNMLGQHVRYRHEPAAFATSIFGMKALMSGTIRNVPRESSRIAGNDRRYSHLMLSDNKLKGFIFVWERSQKRPDVFALRRALVNQSPVNENSF